ncbi:hypothetical protein EJ06DRAFT_525172 [Trichodelitschia bisporula]|uniref:Origin recognition complex subunit 4 n=1 Tax=Trichodelitschia bisporula TaxID=703511 RepID=A0A6G1HIP0_9PEZI|nr:hypothetical protein EJ06DRAFT_525172 [Trichodelitschia bisporula]
MTETPRVSKRRRLNSQADVSSSRTADPEPEPLDVYDDIDGALNPRATPKRVNEVGSATKNSARRSARQKSALGKSLEVERSGSNGVNGRTTPSRVNGASRKARNGNTPSKLASQANGTADGPGNSEDELASQPATVNGKLNGNRIHVETEDEAAIAAAVENPSRGGRKRALPDRQTTKVTAKGLHTTPAKPTPQKRAAQPKAQPVPVLDSGDEIAATKKPKSASKPTPKTATPRTRRQPLKSQLMAQPTEATEVPQDVETVSVEADSAEDIRPESSPTKPRRATKKPELASQAEPTEIEDMEMGGADEMVTVTKPTPKKCGRPPKSASLAVGDVPARNILTPRKRGRPPKSKLAEENGENEVPATTPKRRGRPPKKANVVPVIQVEVPGAAAKIGEYDGPDPMDLDIIVNDNIQELTFAEAVGGSAAIPVLPMATKDIPQELNTIKKIVLEKIAQKRPIPLTGLDEEYGKVYHLMEATITSGEGNSMLLIGARGSGKSALVSKAIQELSRSQKDHFHVVRLNGFIHTDDKLALRDVWRQLGSEMELEEDNGVKSYADTLTMLLALLSHPSEITGDHSDQVIAKSVVFIMDEFDLFASHPRQTLLYNLLDIAQSRKAPIAVLGLTTRIDVMESLEKRVKSRFSHRYVHLSLPKSLTLFVEACKAALMVQKGELDFTEKALLIQPSPRTSLGAGTTSTDYLTDWNNSITTLFTSRPFLQTYISPPYALTKSLPSALTSFFLPLSTLSTLPTADHFLSHPPTLLSPPHSNLHLLPSLSDLALALLISAARLSIIHATDTCNFGLAYAEYVSLSSKARIQTAAHGALAVGASVRVWGKHVARKEWEGLIAQGLLVPVLAGAATGWGEGRVAGGAMVRVDVALEEISGAAGSLSGVMERWCRHI